MASNTAKRAAGTYIADDFWNLPTTLAWMTSECRQGALSPAVKKFCEVQTEPLDQALVIVEAVTGDCIHCRIPCRCYDHESEGTFEAEVKFTLDPQTGSCQRL